ncbi:MAG: hypothetical protein R3C26_04135 [Calditrichia bacterium]
MIWLLKKLVNLSDLCVVFSHRFTVLMLLLKISRSVRQLKHCTKPVRNNLGRVTAWQSAVVVTKDFTGSSILSATNAILEAKKVIEYDLNRSANIALLHYVDGEKRYII